MKSVFTVRRIVSGALIIAMGVTDVLYLNAGAGRSFR
jgi:hypothetical protein